MADTTIRTPDITHPVNAGDFAPMLEAMAVRRLLLPRCRECESWSWPPTDTCRSCRVSAMAWTDVLPLESSLFSYTVVWHTRLPGHVDDVPYTVGIVEVSDTGIRLVGGIEVAHGQQLSLGELLTPVFGSSPGGTPVLGWIPKSATSEEGTEPPDRMRTDVSV